MTSALADLPAMIAKRVRIIDSGCWLWTGATNPKGYGHIGRNGRTLYVHRVVYETLVAPIPDGLTIDHLCHVRTCVNPQHLEPITRAANTLRSWTGPSAVNARKTHCPRGHEYSPANTIVNNRGERVCRECNRADAARRYQARRT